MLREKPQGQKPEAEKSTDARFGVDRLLVAEKGPVLAVFRAKGSGFDNHRFDKMDPGDVSD